MTWNEDMCRFVTEHIADDTARLLLSANRYPGIDMPFAVEQIEARRRIRTKLPQWYALPRLLMGGRIAAEQCSSEQTARFKRSVMLTDAHSLCDMTGGFGVDFWYMSQGMSRAIYTERQHSLCEVVNHNFPILAAEMIDSLATPNVTTHIDIREGVSTELPVPDVDVIYIDPARRATDGSRVYEISDCEPNVIEWQDELLSHCRQLIVKVSPMADITRTIALMKGVKEVYVLSARGECKELLLVQIPGYRDSITVHCIDLLIERTIQFHFPLSATPCPQPVLADVISRYFYEPDVSIMKAQGFGALSLAFGVKMLDRDCHYFTSEVYYADFPGRIFEVEEQIEFSSRNLRRLKSLIPQANIACRNFILSPDELRARSAIRDGGNVYLFGASLAGVGPVLLRCRKVDASCS